MFNAAMCHSTAAHYENKAHVPRKFDKSAAAIAEGGDESHRPKEYPYATKNVAHIFSTELDDKRIRAMFEEPYIDEYKYYNGSNKKRKKKHPYLVNLHNHEGKSPYKWLIGNGKDARGEKVEYTINPIKFFFCAKHENSGKIESHLWFFKGF